MHARNSIFTRSTIRSCDLTIALYEGMTRTPASSRNERDRNELTPIEILLARMAFAEN